MKPHDIRQRSTTELYATLHEKQKRISEVYFNLAAGRVKNVKEANTLRREIAQVKTVIHEKEKEKNNA